MKADREWKLWLRNIIPLAALDIVLIIAVVIKSLV